MNTWVHRLKIDGVVKCLCNADFRPMYDANGCKMPSQMEWTPIKVVIPETYVPLQDEDGQITIETLDGERVSLASVLDIYQETGAPALRLGQSVRVLEEA